MLQCHSAVELHRCCPPEDPALTPVGSSPSTFTPSAPPWQCGTGYDLLLQLVLTGSCSSLAGYVWFPTLSSLKGWFMVLWTRPCFRQGLHSWTAAGPPNAALAASCI